MYKKKDLKIGAIIQDCKIIAENDNEYTLECVHCRKLYYKKFDLLRKRKSDFCDCNNNWTKHIKEDLTNNKYGDLIVIELDTDKTRRENYKKDNGKYATFWKCVCVKCGNITYKKKCDLDHIVKRNASGCNVCFGNCLIGQKFGRLTVLNNHKSENGAILWECECDCENKTHIWASHSSLVSENTTSCGCIRIEKLLKWRKDYYDNYIPQGDTVEYPRLYYIYKGMKSRCYNPNNTHYNRYGGRGIVICDEWLNNFVLFKDWALANGYSDELTIDRIDNDGNYEPSNCRWATAKEQANNTSKNKYIEYQGRTQTLTQWCEELDLPYDRTKARLNSCGMSVEEAFNKSYYKNDGSRDINKNNVYKSKGE